MNIKGKDFLNMPIEKLNGLVNNMMSWRDNKVLKDSEVREFKSQLLSFGHAMAKCGNGHIVPTDMKGLVKDFEKADFDFTKLPTNLKMSFDSTYRDLKLAIANSGAELKGTSADVYCKVYEFFQIPKNLKFINRIRKDPIAKKSGISTESVMTMESLEQWLANPQSVEIFGGVGAVTASIAETSTAIIDMSNTITIFSSLASIMLLAILAFIVILTIINLQYKSELNLILAGVSGVDIKRRGGRKRAREEHAMMAAKNMWEKTTPLTKSILIKPVDNSITVYGNLADKSYGFFDKMLKICAKRPNLTKEDLEPLYSSESPAAMAVAGGAMSLAWSPIIVITSIILLVIMIKPIVYAIYNLRLKASMFFIEEAQMVNMNIEDLVEDQEEAVSEAEKQRLQKVIDKQRSAAKKLASLGNFFYKSVNEATLDARDDIRENDSVDYDTIIDQQESTYNNGDGAVDSPYAPTEKPSVPSGSVAPSVPQPVILF